jgi:hypothetical protein
MRWTGAVSFTMGVANTAQPKLSPGHPLAGAFLRVLVLVHKQARLPGQASSGPAMRSIVSVVLISATANARGGGLVPRQTVNRNLSTYFVGKLPPGLSSLPGGVSNRRLAWPRHRLVPRRKADHSRRIFSAKLSIIGQPFAQ